MKLNLQARIVILVQIMLLLVGALLMYLSGQVYNREFINLYRDEAMDKLHILANSVDADAMVAMVEKGIPYDEVDLIQAQFNSVKEESQDMAYLYMVVPYDDHFVYALEAQASRDDPDTIAPMGESYEYEDYDYEYFLPDVKRASDSETPLRIKFADNYNYVDSFSVWSPVIGSNGKTALMIEADISLARMNEIIENRMRNIRYIMIVLFVVLAVLLTVSLRIIIINPIEALTKQVDSYESGHYAAGTYKFRFDDELKRLSDSFKKMVGRIDYYVDETAKEAAEKEHLFAELSLASRIQSSYLPSEFPAFPSRKEFDIYASMTPAKDVGGDFYDFFMPDDDHLVMVIADVSGKGIPAALFMMVSRMAIRNAAAIEKKPSRILETANNQIDENNPENMFVTVWLGIVEISTGKLTYANAGHSRTLLFNNGVWDYVDTKAGLPLAAFAPIHYRDYELTLDRGSFLFQYTDGVTEAENANADQYGKDRLMEAVQGTNISSPEELLRDVRQSVDKFVDGAPQFDDLTMLGFYYKGPEMSSAEEHEV